MISKLSILIGLFLNRNLFLLTICLMASLEYYLHTILILLTSDDLNPLKPRHCIDYII